MACVNVRQAISCLVYGLSAPISGTCAVGISQDFQTDFRFFSTLCTSLRVYSLPHFSFADCQVALQLVVARKLITRLAISWRTLRRPIFSIHSLHQRPVWSTSRRLQSVGDLPLRCHVTSALSTQRGLRTMMDTPTQLQSNGFVVVCGPRCQYWLLCYRPVFSLLSVSFASSS